MSVSCEQLHRVIDDLSAGKLPALADLILRLTDEDDEVRSGQTLSFYDVFPEGQCIH